MAIVQCASCKKATINTDGICQYCNKPLKVGMWQRKMRRNEAYGIILVALGGFTIPLQKIIGLVILLAGVILIVPGLIRPRVRP